MSKESDPRIRDLAEKLKELIRKGDIARIQLLRREELILNLPLNAGLAGAALGLTAPWTLAAAAAAALGFDCRVILVKVSGETVELLSREKGRRAAAFTRDLAAGLADRFNGK